MKRRIKDLAILLLILGTIGIVLLVSGAVPINASSGHWQATRWILDFASDRSIDFHSATIETPALDEEDMLTLGAATYHSNCRWCHGQPGGPKPVVPGSMTPSPPYLPDSVGSREPRELHYIVKHGIKFTGMPAWPTHLRDEEIWPVVAFLLEFPGMNEDEYSAHVEPKTDTDSDVVHLVRDSCAACHGTDGNGRAGRRVPLLAGQSREYLQLTLQAYREGKRRSGIMQPIAARLKGAEIESLANYFADQQRELSVASDSELFELGQHLANEGNAEKKIASCVDCHGPGPISRRDQYPTLVGQPVWYIENQLRLFSEKYRGGTENANLMHPIADKLTPEQMHALAVYYAQATN